MRLANEPSFVSCTLKVAFARATGRKYWRFKRYKSGWSRDASVVWKCCAATERNVEATNPPCEADIQ